MCGDVARGGAGASSPAGSRPGGGDGAVYEIRLLGDFQVWQGRRRVVFARGAESTTVKLLALHGGMLHRERLCAALWPHDPAVVALGRVRNVLSRIRAQADGLVARNIDPVEFAVPVWVDVNEFMRRSAAAIRLSTTAPETALAEGAAALEVYGGSLLPCDRYADWVRDPREQVAARRVTLLEMLADVAEACGAVHLADLYREQAAYADSDGPPGG